MSQRCLIPFFAEKTLAPFSSQLIFEKTNAVVGHRVNRAQKEKGEEGDLNPAEGGIAEKVSDSHDFEADVRDREELDVVGESFRPAKFPAETLLAEDEAVRSIDGGDEEDDQINHEECGEGAEDNPDREVVLTLKRRTLESNS